MTDDVDARTDIGFSFIEWATMGENRYGDLRESWVVHPIMHDGDGPLDKPMTVRPSLAYPKKIMAEQAAEIAAERIYDQEDGIEAGDSIVIKVAVQVEGMKFVGYGVTVRMQPSFSAREL